MPTTRQIRQIIDDSNSLKFITQTFSEIASLNLKRIREQVEKNRAFFFEIAQVYKIVQQVAQAKKITYRNKIDKTINVIISSNYRFYGDLNNEPMRFFLSLKAIKNADTVVVGKTGVEFLKAYYYNKKYQNIIFSRDLPSEIELKKLALQINPYKRILVFHPLLKTVLSQVPVVNEITQSLSIQQQNVAINFILEPEISKIMYFFDTQITTLLLEQTFLEAELARTGARLISMNKAENNASDFIKEQNRKLGEAKRTIVNNQLLETFSALVAWRNNLNGC